jgi:hypothetical protein
MAFTWNKGFNFMSKARKRSNNIGIYLPLSKHFIFSVSFFVLAKIFSSYFAYPLFNAV